MYNWNYWSLVLKYSYRQAICSYFMATQDYYQLCKNFIGRYDLKYNWYKNNFIYQYLKFFIKNGNLLMGFKKFIYVFKHITKLYNNNKISLYLYNSNKASFVTNFTYIYLQFFYFFYKIPIYYMYKIYKINKYKRKRIRGLKKKYEIKLTRINYYNHFSFLFKWLSISYKNINYIKLKYKLYSFLFLFFFNKSNLKFFKLKKNAYYQFFRKRSVLYTFN